jgi:hypothetical protein
MNEATLTQLKIIVERAVRPVLASTYHKRKMREELLSHVSEVFEEESVKLNDVRAALEQTALRFGNPADVTGQLQESVPASDGIRRYCEARPGESMLRGALRFALIEGAICLGVLAIALLAAEWFKAWSREELIAVFSSTAFLPMWLGFPVVLFAIVLLAHGMEKLLLGPEPLTGWPRIGLRKLTKSAWAVPVVRFGMIGGGLCLFVLVCVRGSSWPSEPLDWGNRSHATILVPLAGCTAAFCILCAWILVQTAAERRRYHEEWARLPIEPCS